MSNFSKELVAQIGRNAIGPQAKKGTYCLAYHLILSLIS